MIWAAILACGVSAAAHVLGVVPRLRVPVTTDDEPPPDYRALATPAGTAAVAAAALVTAVIVLPRVPTSHLVMWFGYLGAGAALAWVDLRTTWLPRTLNLICLTQVLLGLGIVGLWNWPTLLAGLLGGAAAYGMFHLVWALGSGFGYGDVRLAGIVGTVAGAAGLQSWVTSILLATVIGALWAVAHWLRTRRAAAASPFPYGPALWLGPIAAIALPL